MVFEKFLGPFSKNIFLARNIRGEKALRDSDLETAYFQIGSAIITHTDLPKILDLIVRESLNSLRAHRVTIFLMEEESGILKPRFTDTLGPLFRQMGLSEER